MHKEIKTEKPSNFFPALIVVSVVSYERVTFRHKSIVTLFLVAKSVTSRDDFANLEGWKFYDDKTTIARLPILGLEDKKRAKYLILNRVAGR